MTVLRLRPRNLARSTIRWKLRIRTMLTDMHPVGVKVPICRAVPIPSTKYLDTIRNYNVRDREHFLNVTLHHTPSQSFLHSPTESASSRLRFSCSSFCGWIWEVGFFRDKDTQFIDMSMTRI